MITVVLSDIKIELKMITVALFDISKFFDLVCI